MRPDWLGQSGLIQCDWLEWNLLVVELNRTQIQDGHRVGVCKQDVHNE